MRCSCDVALLGDLIDLVELDVGRRPTLQVLGALAAVDVLRHQVLKRASGHAGATGEGLDPGVIHGEAGQLTTEICGDHQTRAVPEVLVIAQDASEGLQEAGLQVRCHVAIDHVLDAEALVDQPEEACHVVGEVTLASFVDDLRHAGTSQRARVALARTEVAVQPTHGLVERDRGDQIAATHVLAPRHLVVEHELRLLGRDLEHQVSRRNGLRQVPEDDVRVQTGLTDVQRLEAGTFPCFVGVEVDDCADVGHEAFVDELFTSALALQSVDDVDVVLKNEDAIFDLLGVVAAHAQIDVWDPTDPERLLEHFDLARAQNLTLVGVGLDFLEVRGVDDAAHHDGLLSISEGEDVDCSIDDANHGGVLSLLEQAPRIWGCLR